MEINASLIFNITLLYLLKKEVTILKRPYVYIFACILFLASSIPALAHIGSSYKWGSNVVYYYPNLNQLPFDRANEAASDWNSNVPDFQFRQTNPGGHSLYMGTVEDPTNHSAETYVDIINGVIDDVDTCFSTTVNWNYSTSDPYSYQVDFLSIAKHEFGHWYMLWDCYDDNHYSTVMYWSCPPGKIARTITSHDYTPARDMY